VATTVKATTKAERATVVGATRTRAKTVTTVTTVATMRPNGYKENEDGNSKNNKKATFNGKERGGNDSKGDSKGDSEGGKGVGGRG